MGLFNFSKKPDYIPSDEFLSNELCDKYFFRTIPFRLINSNKIVASDPESSHVITFDPWPEGIFINANGKITLKEFLIDTAKAYRGQIPPTLEKTIIEEIERLIKNNFISVSEFPVELDKSLLYPQSNNL